MSKKTIKSVFPTRIGLIGVGLVGSALTELLSTQGYQLYGYDIIPEKCQIITQHGGVVCVSPIEVASNCDRIIISLMTSTIVQSVLEGPQGILSSKHRPTFIIDSSTIEPETSVSLAQRCRESGIEYLDAPISGSSGQIGRHEGMIMVGGSRVAFDKCDDLWTALGRRTFYMGESGSGSQAKLIVNLVVGLNRLVLAEGLVFAEHIGVNLPNILQVLKESAGYSKVMDIKGERMIKNQFEPEAKLNQHRKDVGLILSQAEKLKLILPLSNLHSKILDDAIRAGDGDLDNSSIIKQLRR
jgi:3-hydroxyisobutyrate dehydrogenase-like beta-hydroxyacid dehydrogenase